MRHVLKSPPAEGVLEQEVVRIPCNLPLGDKTDTRNQMTAWPLPFEKRGSGGGTACVTWTRKVQAQFT
jgi:hypothetical protein